MKIKKSKLDSVCSRLYEEHRCFITHVLGGKRFRRIVKRLLKARQKKKDILAKQIKFHHIINVLLMFVLRGKRGRLTAPKVAVLIDLPASHVEWICATLFDLKVLEIDEDHYGFKYLYFRKMKQRRFGVFKDKSGEE